MLAGRHSGTLTQSAEVPSRRRSVRLSQPPAIASWPGVASCSKDNQRATRAASPTSPALRYAVHARGPGRKSLTGLIHPPSARPRPSSAWGVDDSANDVSNAARASAHRAERRAASPNWR